MVKLAYQGSIQDYAPEALIIRHILYMIYIIHLYQVYRIFRNESSKEFWTNMPVTIRSFKKSNNKI